MRGSAGEPLPSAFKSLENRGIVFRRSSTVLVVAPPGGAKSLLALHQAVLGNVPTFYFSADSDETEQTVRQMCITYKISRADAEAAVKKNEIGPYEERLAALNIRWGFDPNPSLDDIESKLKAFAEVYGEWPSMVVVDNLTNVQFERANGDDDPFSGLEPLMEYFNNLARRTQACVMVLHHVTGGYNDGDKPIPLSGVKGQIARIPSMVVSVRRVEDEGQPDLLLVSPVKNRAGRPDPSGKNPVALEFEGARMAIREPRM